MKNTIKIFAIFLFIIVIIGVIIIGGGPVGVYNFIDLPSIAVVILIPFSMCIFAGLGPDYVRAFQIGVGFREFTLKEYKASSIALGLMIKVFYLSGFIGSFIGILMILKLLDDIVSVSSSISVAMLTFLYSLFFNIIQHAIKANIDKEIVYREK